jgi:hypothetical protein
MKFHILCFVALVAAPILGCTSAHAQISQFVAVPEQTMGTPPDDVSLSLRGVPKTCTKGNGGTYTGEIRVAPETDWETDYVLTGRWGGTRQKVFLRATRLAPPDFKVWIYNRGYSADKQTLDRFDVGDLDLPPLLERYFVARDVYYGINNPLHEQKARALLIWHKAAFNLVKNYPFMGTDVDVVKLAAEAEERAKTDFAYRFVLSSVVPTNYFTEANKQVIALAWRDVGLVAKFAKRGDVANARSVNTYFLEKYQLLSAEDQLIVAKTQGVNGALLDANASFFRTLESKM